MEKFTRATTPKHEQEKPRWTAERALEYVKQPGKALDLGMGSGRNSIFLAKQGFVVDAVDVSPQAVVVLREALEAYRGSAIIVSHDGEMQKAAGLEIVNF